MKIDIRPVNGGYEADFPELPGSPSVGHGKTPEIAVACLFVRNQNTLKNLDFNYLEMNGTPWENIYKNDR